MSEVVHQHGRRFHCESAFNLRRDEHKKSIQVSVILVCVLLITASLAVPAFAITEAEVEAEVNSVGKETVTGNVLIWFLCAVSFLKVSQKIDSFMASLGVNVGHTGGSMLAEVMIATRGISTVAGAFGGAVGRRSTSGSTSNAAGATGSTGFLKGGLSGVVSRKVTSDAVKTATATTSAVNSVKSQTTAADVCTATATEKQASHSEQSSVQRTATSSTASHSNKSVSSFKSIGLGGAMFSRSLMSGGSFANDVIGTVARGDIRSTGSITGDMAAQSLMSYMGYTALGDGAGEVPAFSDVEIGGGRITGVETAPGSSEGIAFGMYHAEQYAAPQGDYTKVHSADGTLWYKQYARDTVERKPYKAPDDTVAYHESIVKKLPDPPKRKDRM